jgi:hypothetical protein
MSCADVSEPKDSIQDSEHGENLKSRMAIKDRFITIKIDTIYTYDIPFDRSFLQLSDGIRHVMPSTDRKLELKAKDIDGSDCLTAGCVSTNLASLDGCVCQGVKILLFISKGSSDQSSGNN